MATYGGRGVNELTQTERRIMALVADGRTNQEIADHLRVRPKTVEWNLTKIYRKLNVTSRNEAVERCRELGLL